MNKKLLLLVIILVTLVATIVSSYVTNEDKIGNLIGPRLVRTSSPTPSVVHEPPQAPKTFDFDASTDLKAELEKVNPQVLDSDFNE